MGALFGGREKPNPVVKMPDMADPELKAVAERRRRVEQQQSGRASTILSRGQAGTGAYGNQALGDAL